MWLAWTVRLLTRFHPHGVLKGLILNPLVFARIVFAIGRRGTWSSHGTVVRGPVLFFFWMCEAGLVIAAGVLLPGRGLYSDDPVCAGCGRRCVQAPRFQRFSAGRQAEFLSAVEGRHFDSLAGFAPPEHADAPELAVKLMSCPDCGTTHVLTVSWVGWQTINRRAVVKIRPLINQLLITADEAASLSAAMEEVRLLRATPVPATPPPLPPAEPELHDETDPQ
jgi:hypothetical protein